MHKQKCRSVLNGIKTFEKVESQWIRRHLHIASSNSIFQTDAYFRVTHRLLSASKATIWKVVVYQKSCKWDLLKVGSFQRLQVWQLLKYTNSFFEWRQIWQSVFEGWVSSIDLCEVPRLPRLYTNKGKSEKGFIAIGKVDDDSQVIDQIENVHFLIKSISQKFNLGRSHIDETVVFDRIGISQQGHEYVIYDM